MHCWKSFNVKRQYGSERLFMMSALIGLAVFTVFYVIQTVIHSSPLSDQYFSVFLLAMIAIYPLHKLLHFLPLIRHRSCLRLMVKRQASVCPTIVLRIKEPINKAYFIVALLLPFLLINTGIILLSIQFPSFSHYFSLLLAYHTGLCLVDLLYVWNALRSPKDALIEETETGYEILVPPVSI